jgi:hypothetical protein
MHDHTIDNPDVSTAVIVVTKDDDLYPEEMHTIEMLSRFSLPLCKVNHCHDTWLNRKITILFCRSGRYCRELIVDAIIQLRY